MRNMTAARAPFPAHLFCLRERSFAHLARQNQEKEKCPAARVMFQRMTAASLQIAPPLPGMTDTHHPAMAIIHPAQTLLQA